MCQITNDGSGKLRSQAAGDQRPVTLREICERHGHQESEHLAAYLEGELAPELQVLAECHHPDVSQPEISGPSANAHMIQYNSSSL